jgi:outer membrane protein
MTQAIPAWNFIILTVLGLLSWPAASARAEATPYTLKQAFDAALEKTETYRLQQSVRNQVDEQVTQAKGAILPSLDLNASYLRQDDSPATGSTSAFTRQDQSTARLTLSQPLFRGFSEFAALRATRAQLRAEDALVEQSKLDVYENVSQAFYEVLSAEQDAADLKTQRQLTEKRVTELRGRTRIGRSRPGELYQAESQLAAVDALLEAALTRIDQARDRFALATALPRSARMQDGLALPASLAPLKDYLARIEIRPDIAAQRERVEYAESAVSVARGSHWPTLDLTGNYYLKRTGVLENSKWDVGVSATLPIFAGGVIQSRVRQAAEVEKSASLTLSQSRRTAEAAIATRHAAAQSGIDQIRSLKKAAELAERNYEAQIRDYRLGLVTNLDVFSSLNSYIDAKRAYDRAFFQTKVSLISLKAATGELSLSDAPAGGQP